MKVEEDQKNGGKDRVNKVEADDVPQPGIAAVKSGIFARDLAF